MTASKTNLADPIYHDDDTAHPPSGAPAVAALRIG